jgi:hypothetical protein
MSTGQFRNERDPSYGIGRREPEFGLRKTTRVISIYDLRPVAILVNIISDTQCGQSILDRIASKALKAGGSMEHFNGEIAVYAFPDTGILKFMEELGREIRMMETKVCPRQQGISKVNIRFRTGQA